ncbi:MAG: hypothetical protein K6G63_04295 [Eubacterium sp.]|nr:hypothetical protein [Eubacterium sp.]
MKKEDLVCPEMIASNLKISALIKALSKSNFEDFEFSKFMLFSKEINEFQFYHFVFCYETYFLISRYTLAPSFFSVRSSILVLLWGAYG